MEVLRVSIVDLRCKREGRYFVPEMSFYQLMTYEAILQALPGSILQKPEVASRVYEHGRRIFGVLILANLADLLMQFFPADLLDDARLPFDMSVLKNELKFEPSAAETFEEKQWELAVPKFARGTLSRRFNEHVILPFTNEDDKLIGGGAFGLVYKTAIIPNHQEFGCMFPEQFVRKEMARQYDHETELSNLTILSQIKHPNVVELLGSYTQHGKHNLLFPLCSDGNLSQLFSIDRSSTPFNVESTLLVAVADLAAAIEHVHDFAEERLDLALIGCHHDLRPPNILVSGSRLILADFGISTFKPAHEESDTDFRSVNSDYIAPECEDWADNFRASDDIHRSVDIWAFGGILANIATYLTQGSKAVEEFRERRMTKHRKNKFYTFHNGPGQPSKVVEQQLQTLTTTYPQTSGMLVDTARRMLAVDQKQRPKAGEVTIRLRFTAIMNIAYTIDQRFVGCRKSNDTLDKAIEKSRFDSWVYAIGVDDFEARFDPNDHGAYQLGAHFTTIVKYLDNIREELDLVITYDSEGQHRTMSSISSHIDHLEMYLDREQQQKARTHFMLGILEDNQIPEDLRSLEEQREWKFGETSLNKEIRMRAIIKHMNTLVSSASALDQGSNLINANSVHSLSGTVEFQFANLKQGAENREIFIDWRYYLESMADETTLGILHTRVAHLADTLSKFSNTDIRTLSCLGYFHSLKKPRFGIVFEIPRGLNSLNKVKPTTLAAIIAETTQRTRAWPVLEDRYRLAGMLSKSLFGLHTVGILHKSLTSSNVAFFPSTVAHIRDSVKEPFLIGFSHSRTDEPQAFTEGMVKSSTKDYQHPLYIKQGKGYRAEFDYYSLGIILLEIGCWKPYSKIVEELTIVEESTNRERACSYEERPQKLFGDSSKIIQYIAIYMGRTYLDSVRFCILGGNNVNEDGDGAEIASKKLLLAFEEKVVRPLNKHFC